MIKHANPAAAAASATNTPGKKRQSKQERIAMLAKAADARKSGAPMPPAGPKPGRRKGGPKDIPANVGVKQPDALVGEAATGASPPSLPAPASSDGAKFSAIVEITAEQRQADTAISAGDSSGQGASEPQTETSPALPDAEAAEHQGCLPQPQHDDALAVHEPGNDGNAVPLQATPTNDVLRSTDVPNGADRAQNLTTAGILVWDINRIDFDMRSRRPLAMDFVNSMADSIRLVGLQTPIAVRVEGARARGVTGAHRHAACRQLGWSTVPVRVIPETMSAAEIELIEIDENLVRKDLDAAQLDLAIARRAELVKAIAEEEEKAFISGAGQKCPPSKQAQRRAGKKTGPDAASARDLARKTGLSEGRIKRARKRVEVLGTEVLERVQGTALAKPGELDALVELPQEEREAKVAEAVVEAAKPEGKRKKVSARSALPSRVAETIGDDAVTRAMAAMQARVRPTPEEYGRRVAAIRRLEPGLDFGPARDLVGSAVEFDAEKLRAIAKEPRSKRPRTIAYYRARADERWLTYDFDPAAREFKEFARAAAKLPTAMLAWAADLIAEMRAAHERPATASSDVAREVNEAYLPVPAKAV
jgi:hypothetical protein